MDSTRLSKNLLELDTSARSTWRDDYETLQKWKRATLLLNASRRFRYIGTVRRSELLRRLQASAQAVKAITLFLKAGTADLIDFKVDPDKLAHLMQEHQTESLQELGGIEGVTCLLRTSPDKGVTDDLQELEARREVFGSNAYPRQPPKSFWAFAVDSCKHFRFIILMVSVVLSLVMGIETEGIGQGWYDGVSIVFVVILVILVTSISHYMQYLQISSLNEEERNIQVQVMRGGRRKEISIFQVVVGDIVLLNIGDQVPADGLFVDGHSLHINQSSLSGHSEPIHVHHRMPFLLSGGKVDDGQGVMVVTGVGMSTEWGKVMAAIGENTRKETPLQERLNAITATVGKVELTVKILVFTVLIIFYFVGHTKGSRNSGYFMAGKTSAIDAFYSVLNIFLNAMTIVVLEVPEGLPLAVALSLAYGMKKMNADKALVRRLPACETIGIATSICSDKTGTLTLNQMTVVKAWVADGMRNLVSDLQSLHKNYYKLLIEGIAQNSNGSVFVPVEGGDPQVTGSATEKATLLWGLKMGMDYSFVRSQSTILQVESFNSIKKRAGVAVRAAESGTVRVHWKGAAEILLGESDKLLRPDNTSTMPITTDVRNHLLNVIEGMAAESLRCIELGYMEVDVGEVPIGEWIEEWKVPEGPLTLLAILGIRDPCRPEVREAVRQCQAAGVRVRMVTGDNIMTARAIASECGILREGDLAIEGATFRNYTPDMRAQELPKIVVMARSSPSDKLLMVSAMRNLGEVVAVTGDGIHDAPALEEADIGLAMGMQGTQVAKESSDIIIMDDNFASVVKAVQWGRSVHLSIQKLIQFQLTVNVAALTINVVAVMSSSSMPLSAVQLLWVHLIVDTLGAFALATERPTDKLLQYIPEIGPKHPLISNVMWCNILGQVLYQLVVLLLLHFGGEGLIMLLSGFVGAGSIKNTVIFNAFVFCQLCNLVNARKLEERNVFQGLFTNRLFLGILGTTVVLQAILIEFLNKFASTVKLDWQFWAISIMIGSLSWPIAFLVKTFHVMLKDPTFMYPKTQHSA